MKKLEVHCPFCKDDQFCTNRIRVVNVNGQTKHSKGVVCTCLKNKEKCPYFQAHVQKVINIPQDEETSILSALKRKLGGLWK